MLTNMENTPHINNQLLIDKVQAKQTPASHCDTRPTDIAHGFIYITEFQTPCVKNRVAKGQHFAHTVHLSPKDEQGIYK